MDTSSQYSMDELHGNQLSFLKVEQSY